MKIYKIASKDSDDIKSIKDDLKDIMREHKEIKSDIKKFSKMIDDLNIGNRLITQRQSIFTSLQRKIERFEKMELEWKSFKSKIEKFEEKIEKKVEKDLKNG